MMLQEYYDVDYARLRKALRELSDKDLEETAQDVLEQARENVVEGEDTTSAIEMLAIALIAIKDERASRVCERHEIHDWNPEGYDS